MINVLLLDGGLQGLSFGESLFKREGIGVSVASNEYGIERSCFFKHKYINNKTGYDERLKDAFEDNYFNVIVPMGDKAASYLSKYKGKIETTYKTKCAVPDYSILSVVEDKSSFMAFCRDNDIPHPRTLKLTEESLLDSAGEIGFPALIKPDHSVGARGITRVDTIEDLNKYYPEISKHYGTCTLQEFVDNPDYYYNVMMYRDVKGDCLGTAIIKIVRMFPIRGGSSSCCITVENEELEDLCKSVLDKLGWVGMADFDVLQRKDTGEYKIIEINPRVPASLRAAYVSGVNFPELIVADTLKRPIPEYHYHPGKTLRYMGLDLMWFLKSSRRISTSPSWLNFIGNNIYYQDIIWCDSSTWYSWLVTGLNKLKRRLR